MLLARLIPAHAGKTRTPWPGRYGQAAHPRSRGENTWLLPRGQRARGSSPLTRGKRQQAGKTLDVLGLIPAHAGKTLSPRPRRQSSEAHPRSRGENENTNQRGLLIVGSSPLTRGKPVGGVLGNLCPRLIPAHAGKTNWEGCQASPRAAHPRSRGENLQSSVRGSRRRGSSPLTRGKLPGP